MNWWRRKLISALFFVFLAYPLSSGAAVYIYEVVTAGTSFQTYSKLTPDAFLMYNGGEDVIHKLKVLQIYADKDLKQALKDYDLENKNVRFLPHIAEPPNIPRRPYYWWR